MSILGTILRDVIFYGIYYGIFLFGLFSLARLAYVRSVPVRHRVVNHAAERAAITAAATDRFIREQEHELYPDEKHDHVNCSICGPGPLLQGMVPSKYEHPFFTKTMETRDDGYGTWKVEALKAATAETAEMVSSKVIEPETGIYTGQHTLMLDLDLPATLIESSTAGHYHLYADRRMTWRQYRGVLKAMEAAGLIETGYYKAALRQGSTMLRPPWVKKQPPNYGEIARRKSKGLRWDHKWTKGEQVSTHELLREGEWTRDGRMLTAGTTTWRSQIPLMMLPDPQQDGHEGGHIVGAVHHIRRKGNLIVGDTDVEVGEDQALTCDLDSIGDPIVHSPERIEVSGGRLIGAYINEKRNYPWGELP